MKFRKFGIGQTVRVRSDLTYRGGQAGVVVEQLHGERYGVRFADPCARGGYVVGDMSESEMQTAAEFVAEVLGNGQQWRFSAIEVASLGITIKAALDDDVSLETVLTKCGAKIDRNQVDEFPDVRVWVFGDGSAIVSAGAGWDVRATGCQWHCWAGAGCSCED